MEILTCISRFMPVNSNGSYNIDHHGIDAPRPCRHFWVGGPRPGHEHRITWNYELHCTRCHQHIIALVQKDSTWQFSFCRHKYIVVFFSPRNDKHRQGRTTAQSTSITNRMKRLTVLIKVMCENESFQFSGKASAFRDFRRKTVKGINGFGD